MNPYERQILNDAEGQVFQTQQEFNEATETSGIRPPPQIEETESILEPQLFGLWFGGQPESEEFGTSPSSTSPIIPSILYYSLDINVHPTNTNRITTFFLLGDDAHSRVFIGQDTTIGFNNDSLIIGSIPNVGFKESATNSFPINSWHTVDVKADSTDPSNPAFTARIDGIALTTLVVPNTPANKMQVGLRFVGASAATADFDNVKVGTTGYGSSDLFLADFTSTIVPPFDSTIGTGLSVSGGQMHASSGGADPDTYALKSL